MISLLVGMLLLGGGGGSIAGLGAACPRCPSCPLTAAGVQQPAEIAAEPSKQQDERRQQHGESAAAPAAAAGEGWGGAPPLCPPVPSVADALENAARALERSLEAAFAPYKEGFTLESVMKTAEALGIDGTHDTRMWAEVRPGTLGGCSLAHRSSAGVYAARLQ